MKRLLNWLQPLGRALMLPIAVLPAAGLLLRIGQPDLLNLPFVAAAGAAVFASLGLLFAVGVAVGFARDGDGVAGLAGVVCYLVCVKGAEALLKAPPQVLAGAPEASRDLIVAAWKTRSIDSLMAPIGIASGLCGGLLFNRFSDLRLPDYLAFFGGRRFVPIVSGFAGVILAAIIGLGYGAIKNAVDALSYAILGSGAVGLFVYGLLNRLLIVTGLHHILNNIVWFVVGDYHGATGDLNRFAAGDPTAGAFMAGYFPIMMFGLPGACLAMLHCARKERRKAVGGLLLSLALTSFLTGVTEPIEFSFMFLAPSLFGLHAVLTGLAMVVMNALGVHLGFGFSAGLFDYVLNFSKSTRPLLLLPIGVATFALYYGLFVLAIRRFDLKTPGREDEAPSPAAVSGPLRREGRGAEFAAALGGSENLVSVAACTTRLRLELRDPALPDEARLRALGARGFVRTSSTGYQVVLGPIADMVARDIRSAADASPSVLGGSAATTPALDAPTEPVVRAKALLEALGGETNLRGAAACGGRLRFLLVDADKVDEPALAHAGARGFVHLGGGVVHVLFGPEGQAVFAALEVVLAKTRRR